MCLASDVAAPRRVLVGIDGTDPVSGSASARAIRPIPVDVAVELGAHALAAADVLHELLAGRTDLVDAPFQYQAAARTSHRFGPRRCEDLVVRVPEIVVRVPFLEPPAGKFGRRRTSAALVLSRLEKGPGHYFGGAWQDRQ
jgi:hypothetical protein